MSDITKNDPAVAEMLTHSRVIAVVGHSDNPDRTSYQIAQFLRRVGYIVYAVNPAVSEIDGRPSYASLADVPEPIDIVNVFRRSQFLPDIVSESVAIGAKVVWAQLGVYDETAAEIAENAGMPIVMVSCIKVEYVRLGVRRSDPSG